MATEKRLNLSGERFAVVYALAGADAAAAREKALDIALEQTVEFPADLLPPGDIAGQVVGRIADLAPAGAGRWLATITYAVETAGVELTQLLNVIFGNSSIKPGVRVERLDLPEAVLRAYGGPRFGRGGLRRRLGVADRPLLCTALKPMGLPAAELAQQAYQCALGGIDIIKDDHGLADQAFAPFTERVERCAEAVARANARTGRRSMYMPNVTAPADRVQERARQAKAAGAGSLLVSPGLTGFDAMRRLADDDAIDLPIMSHPAFLGSHVTSPESGISHYALFGQLMRLAGADATVYPNYGGRFAFSREECRSIADGTAAPMGQLRPIFPTPGGGMSLAAVPDMRSLYGPDVIFLVGGGLHRHGPDLAENARYFLELISQA